ncbi:putative type VI secretion system effector [Acinetobacter pullicarnis]|uniref:putative type VI secretion system effector n=1 Tax=Acinetobacter pullicarnis TaxID=2576829 RepID=UPI00111CE2C0|nr:putative type VI secretion system effector [Acinetobacter pullicarnis]
MVFNKINKLLEEFIAELFIVEGEITDLITRQTLENLNAKGQSHASAIAVGSTLLGQLGSAALVGIAASDDGVNVSEFAIELTDTNGVKHFFKGCFPEVVFKKGDQVKVIAHPFKTDYGYVSAIIDIKNNYMWTSQQVERGRYRYRIFGMKLMGGGGVFVLFVFLVMDYFNREYFTQMFIFDIEMLIPILFLNIIFLFIGWRVGASFDEQSVELEGILKKLGFYKPTVISLNDYTIFSVKKRNKEKDIKYPDRWEQYTYRIDLAQKDDAEKYGKK